MSISSRMLRKFRGDQNELIKNVDEISDLDEVPCIPASRGTINRYGLLNENEPSESDARDDDVDTNGEAESVQTLPPRPNKKKVKRKKKKQQLVSSQDEWDVGETNGDVMQQFSHDKEKPSLDSTALPLNGILAVDRKHLNAKNELKRMFGSRAIEGTEIRNKRGRNRKPLKNLWLAPFRDQWGLVTRSGPVLSMECVEKKDGVMYFRYTHSASYQAVEKQFLACVESMDPDELMLLINKHEFHVNTLIQLSEMSKMAEEFSIAAQLIERALYALECGFHYSFNFKTPCRLDYKYQENRALFIALFNHLTLVGQRACYRTALELSKALLSLSPDDDPLAIILAIDFYAIRAKEYRWLLQFIEEADPTRNLSQLPNYTFSRAVAHFCLDEKEIADKLLQEALIMFPGVLLPILEKCGIKPDARTAGNYFFNNAESRQSIALQQLTQLYVGRNYHIWRERNMMHWLESTTLAVIDRVERDDPFIAEYAAKRTKRFECRTPRAVERHILLSGIKDVAITETGTTFNFDPLPPLDSVNLYTRPERPRRGATYNTLSLFFRSLMPTFNPEEQNGEAAEVLPALEELPLPIEERAMASLHNSMSALLEAMRDLMTTIRSQEDIETSSDEENDGEE